MNRLTITQLSKTYANGVQALKNVSLDIPAGMFGLLGPNGAGKSTLMRTIATLQDADAGSIQFNNLDVLRQKKEVRQLLGYLPQEFGLYPSLTAEVLLDHLAVLKGIVNRKARKERVDALLERTNLYTDRKKKLGGFSGGMKQRFGIAQALLTDPQLLIVDEPTAGLDPRERNRFHNLLSELGETIIVIYSTHIVDDVRELCTKLAIINRGEVLMQGSPLAALEALRGKIYQKTVPKAALSQYRQAFRVISEKLLLGRPVIHILSDSNPGYDFEPVSPEFEDVYFSRMYLADS